MVHVVEVRRIGNDLDASMADMRAWLDHNRIEAAEFRHSTGGPGVAFRVSFAAEADAAAFVQEFDGRLNGEDPDGAVLWR